MGIRTASETYKSDEIIKPTTNKQTKKSKFLIAIIDNVIKYKRQRALHKRTLVET